MPTREHAPNGSPCWVDLWTSDVEGSRKFYAALFGWEAQEPSAEFGGYFMWTRDGVPIAGGVGDMGPDNPADDKWKIYLSTPNVAKTAEEAAAAGATVLFPPMEIPDLGSQTVLIDPTGATVGVWEPAGFPGYTVLHEHGAPSWCELHTRDHGGALSFYRSVFGWETNTVGDTDEFRYTTMRDPSGEGDLAGVMDATSFIPAGASPYWTIYWHVDDVDAAIAKVQSLGGSVVMPTEETPYGILATVADPAGAEFRLHHPGQ